MPARHMHHAIHHGMDQRTNGSGQIDAIVEIPAISIDTQPEGRVYLVRYGALAEGAR